MASTNGSKNGARAKDKVRVAIIGVGNCANSLLQGVEYYKDAKPEDSVPGLMRRFEGPEEFLLSLRTAEVLRRPKSLAYLQSLKWVAQVKEKVR